MWSEDSFSFLRLPWQVPRSSSRYIVCFSHGATSDLPSQAVQRQSILIIIFLHWTISKATSMLSHGSSLPLYLPTLPMASQVLDPRNRPNLHFLAVWQATPLPLLPFLQFNSQRLTVGNSHSFHCNSSAIKPSWADSAASVARLVTYNTGHATACLQFWSIDFRECNIPVHQLLGERGHPLPGRPCYRRKLSPGGFSDTWLAQLYALSPIARGH